MRINKDHLDEYTKDNPLQIKSNADSEEGKPKKRDTVIGEDGEEYEYVSFSEVTTGPIAKAKELVGEYITIIACVIICIICVVLVGVGKNMGPLFIAFAFGLLAAFAVIMLYFAWQDKKKADADYKRAMDIIAPVKEKMTEQALDPDDDSKSDK